MHFADWYQLVAGLMNDTPLGQVVRIRSETDKKVIENFSNYEKRLRSEWTAFRSKQIAQVSECRKHEVANYFDKMFAQMFGGDK